MWATSGSRGDRSAFEDGRLVAFVRRRTILAVGIVDHVSTKLPQYPAVKLASSDAAERIDTESRIINKLHRYGFSTPIVEGV
jgi:hypothetical protein